MWKFFRDIVTMFSIIIMICRMCAGCVDKCKNYGLCWAQCVHTVHDKVRLGTQQVPEKIPVERALCSHRNGTLRHIKKIVFVITCTLYKMKSCYWGECTFKFQWKSQTNPVCRHFKMSTDSGQNEKGQTKPARLYTMYTCVYRAENWTM